jgi:small-conductance mechanosensitive channel
MISVRARRCALVLVGLLALGGGVAPGVAAAQEIANVELQGKVVFPVAGVEGESAALRARRISSRLRSRLATDEPFAPVRVVQVGDSAVLLVDQDTIAQITPRDAEVATARPIPPGGAGTATRRVGEQWAGALREALAGVAARERARVVLQGNPLFEVSGTPELRASRRAAAIGVRLTELAASEAEPAPIRAVARRGGAAVLAGDEVLVEISAAEAEARGVEPAELAADWAGEIERGITVVRQQRSGWIYTARLLSIALAAVLFAVLVHWILRRLHHRLAERRRRQTEAVAGWGLAAVVAEWGVALVQFLAWTGAAVFILWLVPRTRPLTYAAAERTLSAAGRAAEWLFGEGLIVTLIMVTTVLAARFMGAVVHQLVIAVGVRQGGRAALRLGTLAGTAVGITQLLVFFVGFLSILAQLDFDAVPLLASAGVIGIAVGFGVQTLIRDFFTGFFILLEDQYGVGDVIRIGEAVGKVERFTLRITQVRAMDGSLTSIPNGEIKSITNLSKDWAQVVLDVNIAFGEDVDRATAVIAETAKALADEWRDRVRGEPEVLGVETVDPAARALTIRVVLKTAPLERFTVSRELRRRVLDAFAQAGIQAPPRSVVTLSESAPGR